MTPGLMMRDPTAETTSDLRARVAPLPSFAGNTIALLDIGKMRGDEFIDRLEQLCHARGVATRRYKKSTNTRVASREMLKDIAMCCQAAIIALSDCGSCTSCSTHDLDDLDKKGLTGVSVLTEEFRQAFQAQNPQSASMQPRSMCRTPCRTGQPGSFMPLPTSRWMQFLRQFVRRTRQRLSSELSEAPLRPLSKS